ncbi:arylesterase [Aestuariibacter halophilus]|uniref:Arylesterase n=2 Tax=Fluctibacter halophilus TaxID=226011 RepID=A0ABS8G3T0_9ALTE|nr:arylesterase [Aestuariibacter halophilus]MCC2615247.1 arylesterase [Aestuariibacter halophilus]
MVLGDSLSAGYGLRQEQGWVSLLQNAFKPQGIRVVNAAISGETTDGGLARLPRLLEQHQPTHLLIELGGNDGLQGHNVKKIRTNLDSMIEIAKQQGVEVFLQAMQIPTNYGPRYNQLFQDVFYQAGDAHSIPVIPFFLTEIALQPELMQRDGIHPKAEAQPQIAAFMQQQLQPLLQAPVSHSGTQ